MIQTTWERRISHETEAIWLRIIQRHREAHALARCGETTTAKALLEEALPPLIKEWSQRSGLPRNLQILRLRKLLRGDLSAVLKPRITQRKVEQKTVARPLLTPPKVERIPLSAISEMIDSVHISQAEESFHAVAS